MTKNLTSQKSDRTFQIWEYQVSHGQLLIRSPKAPATEKSTAFFTNLDVVCLGVEYVALPSVLHGLELMQPTSDEIQYFENLLGRGIPSETVTIFVSGGKRFSVVAANISISENDWDIFESPFEFRSRFRPGS